MDPENNLEILCKLGEGAYGAVHKARIVSTGEIIAVKTIKVGDEDQGVPSTTLREMTILRNIDHPNIIKLKKYRILMSGCNPRIELFFEYMDQDLAKMMKRIKVVDPVTVKHIMRQILQAVSYMHSNLIFHRDLKPQNILINHAGAVKIADFGLGRIVGDRLETMSKEIQTLWYRSLELLLGTVRYDFAVDIWSIGCIFYELAQGKVLFQTESEVGQIFQILKYQGTPKEQDWKQISSLPFFKPTFPKFKKIKREYHYLDPAGIELLESMIELNPQKRINIHDAKKHRYFKTK